jgi:acetolactate synthase-1/2/3 large subunit
MKPRDILKEVKSLLGDNGILISDVGRHKMMIAKYYKATKPNTVLISNGFCSMSCGMSGAIGAYLARPEQKIMAIIGDGCAQMSTSEMETAARLNANITVNIWEDGGYNLIKYKQTKQFGNHTDLDFNNPKWALIAEAFGWLYTDSLEEAVAYDGPALVVTKVNYEEEE